MEEIQSKALAVDPELAANREELKDKDEVEIVDVVEKKADQAPAEPTGNEREAAETLNVMRNSNIKDIIRGMTVHEQLRLLRNFLDDEEFKRREKMREERESQDSR